ncbi:DNA repair protein RecN [Sphingobacterium paludis]|uniref:DNA repair protein RecN n=1 Tax=Sphingobacterium paludis TaxID=1476465 RepID=A0A4R7D584_9SPHI|nr:DNA repair protein RecN [Sphingobacterium paludis]TDS16283.1 DNA replication and repair protein RecN [Sphingobacterium paludis]
MYGYYRETRAADADGEKRSKQGQDMLKRLFIKNYALIENLDIQFDAGLNIITGETGAGKSIIMGALGLILGNRAEGKHFFNEDQKCVIEGFFALAAYDLQAFFDDNDLDYEPETIIRREVAVDGKSRAFVNDSPVTLAVLKSLGELLIDIHSQHATLQLNTERFQLMVLDSMAKNQEILAAYRTALKGYKDKVQILEQLQADIHTTNAELDFNQFQFDELQEAQLQEGEQEQLEEEINQLENAEEIKRGLLGASHLLDEQDMSVNQALKDVLQHLQAVQRYLPAVTTLAERLQSAQIEIKDIAQEVDALGQEVHMDENRLATVNDRLSILYSLQKKHRVETVTALLHLQNELEQKILAVANREERLAIVQSEVDKSLLILEREGHKLHQSRDAVRQQVEEYVQAVLSEVGMGNAQLRITLDVLPVDRYKASGADEVQFLFSANKGQTLQPIHRVASGGELSRVMLAIKSLVASSSALPTIIFDEIDTGISGEVALKVGQIMERLATNMQVLAISHLPQIASKGHTHFKVYKIDEAEKTRTNIVPLSAEQRVLEIAQMLSGTNPGESALQHARELIGG